MLYKIEEDLYDFLNNSTGERILHCFFEDDEFISDMKNGKNKFGELMNVEYFININFKQLHEKYIELKRKKYENYCKGKKKDKMFQFNLDMKNKTIRERRKKKNQLLWKIMKIII